MVGNGQPLDDLRGELYWCLNALSLCFSHRNSHCSKSNLCSGRNISIWQFPNTLLSCFNSKKCVREEQRDGRFDYSPGIISDRLENLENKDFFKQSTFTPEDIGNFTDTVIKGYDFFFGSNHSYKYLKLLPAKTNIIDWMIEWFRHPNISPLLCTILYDQSSHVCYGLLKELSA